jgi:hypothetical protein
VAEQPATSYTQALPSEPAKPLATLSAKSSGVIRQPANTVAQRSAAEPRHETLQLQPASGWAPMGGSSVPPKNEPVKQRSDNHVQFASFETVSTVTETRNSSKPTAGSSESVQWKPRGDSLELASRKRLNPAEASSRRSASSGVQRASYQEEAPAGGINLPQLPPSSPQLPGANGLNSLLPSQPSNELKANPPQDFGIAPQQKPFLEEVPSRPLLDSPSDRMNIENQDGTEREIPMAPRKRSAIRSTIDCDTIRQAVESSDITQIRVDSSPAFVEGFPNDKKNRRKESFLQNASMRQWYNADGVQIAEGRLVDIVYGSVVLETPGGERTTYLLNKLSDADQVYVSESWGVPFTCSMGDGSFDPRNFTATTMTWKASGACHKPLYFEEVQLERYGHEWGPLVQPAISSLNFVKNAAILPYKMGIHPMNECQYSLGYYRPGSCAPWTVGPIPISLRGAAAQAAAVSGAVLALP